MKRITILLVALSLFLGVRAQQETTIDQVVGVVGQNIVKLSDIENSMAQLRMRQGVSDAHASRCSALESMLISKLLIHKGIVDSVEVADEEVEAETQYYLKAYLRQYGTKEAMRQATGYTYDETHDLLFALTKDRKLSQRVEYNLTQNVKVTPAEVTDYFNRIPADSLPMLEDEYEVAEVMIKPAITEEERDRVRLELNRLRERVLNGEKFAMLATLYSQDPGSAKKGGELGFFTRGEMVGEFEAAAFALKPGEVSPVIETKYGFHIIQLIERRGNSINARHILMIPKVQADAMLQARIRLDSIANEVKLGNITFEEAAQQYSESNTKMQGGLLPNPTTGNNRFSKEVFSQLYPGVGISGMKVGDISAATAMKDEEEHEVFRIIKLVNKVESHKANLADDYDKIYNAALQEAKNNKIMEWAQKQIKNTYIHVADEFKDCNYKLKWF